MSSRLCCHLSMLQECNKKLLTYNLLTNLLLFKVKGLPRSWKTIFRCCWVRHRRKVNICFNYKSHCITHSILWLTISFADCSSTQPWIWGRFSEIFASSFSVHFYGRMRTRFALAKVRQNLCLAAKAQPLARWKLALTIRYLYYASKCHLQASKITTSCDKIPALFLT